MPAATRKRRDELERSMADLRAKKAQIPEDDYYAKLETILVELARLYRDGKAAEPPRSR